MNEKEMGIRKGTIFETENMETYKRGFMYIGESDIAQLTILGYKEAEGAIPEVIHFGGDGSYSAWIVTDESVIPNHYKKVSTFKYWVKIYDDTEKTVDIDIRNGEKNEISVYRAGEYGCLILINE